MEIRAQQSVADQESIRALNDAAFADHGGTEAFDQFRAERNDVLSLLAVEGDNLLGHVLFSPVWLETGSNTVAGMGLGQLAVAPEHQKQGIGSALSEHGIAQLREAGCPFIIVVGHAGYYPRFGFEPGSQHGFKCQWEGIPDDSFMVLILDETRRPDLHGTARFDGMD